ncbi:MAG: glycosyltransferase family 2 protein [Pseudomonadales bacterium]|nr:glycosyltransferase family 2 protein [Pseudomonadales bacterium]
MSETQVMEATPIQPKVSICVITYNQERYIGECLQSLVDQKTTFPFDIVVGDDCSTDGTQAIVASFAKKYPGIVKPIFMEVNSRGLKNYLNTHNAAKGEYVAHMDGDDYALPGKIQAQADALDRMPLCNAVWHRVDFFDDAGRFCSGNTADLSMFSNGDVSFSQAIRLGFVGVHSSLMYRRTSREVLPLDRKVMDLYLTWDLLSKGGGHILSGVFGRYRVASTGSLTVKSLKNVRQISIEHATHFLHGSPEQRSSFFLWAVSNAVVDAKNLRWTTLDFLRFAARHFAWVSPQRIVGNLSEMRRTQVQWGRMMSDSRN